MGTSTRRNLSVENAVDAALDRVDDFIDGDQLSGLPESHVRRACDEVLENSSKSVRVAGLFFSFYRLVEPGWSVQHLPTGLRGKYGDKKLATQLTLRDITLHDNITAFGENLGWKGDVQNVDLREDSNFSKWVSAVEDISDNAQTLVADYFAAKFAESRKVIDPLPAVSDEILTFARAKRLFHSVLSINSNGHIQQFLIAAMLSVFRSEANVSVKTNHPNASDRSNNTYGDIVEVDEENRTVRAYEVTMRPDWKSRITDFKSKMDSAGLIKYTIIAANVNTDDEWSAPANLLGKLEDYGRDIAVIDIEDVINFLSAELPARRLKEVVNQTFSYLRAPRLCGKAEYIQAYRDTVDEWLDESASSLSD